MLRRAFFGLGFLFALAVLGAPLQAADDPATKIKNGVEKFLISIFVDDPEIDLLYALSVEPAGDWYQVLIQDMKVREQGVVEDFPIGDVTFLVKPEGEVDYRFKDVRIPEEFRAGSLAEGSAPTVLRIGLERLNGVISSETEELSELDFLSRNFLFDIEKPVEGGAYNEVHQNTIRIAEMSIALTTEMTGENAASQGVDFKIADLSVSASDQRSDFGIGELSADFDLATSDFAAESAKMTKVFDLFSEAEEVDDQILLQVLRTWFGGVDNTESLSGEFRLQDISYDDPETKFAMADMTISMDAPEAGQDLITISQLLSVRGFSLSKPGDPVAESGLKLLPRRWTVPFTLKRYPMAAIHAAYGETFAQLSSLDLLSQGSPVVGILQERMTEIMLEAGTIMSFDGQSIESDLVSATLDGNLQFDANNPLQLTGLVSAEIQGLMQLFEASQSVQDPQVAQQVMQGTMVLLSSGETVPGGQVPSVTNYVVEFKPEGAVFLNGNQVHPPPAAAQ
ncbi:hypothetical protein [Denitrobaculum tricleocarpae]|uniref:DUF2125 domain-containing protein n=1 Tax=Denitrobaculum tricleocarpae TaxID=2591009 RepID=A0A545TQT2_9PROT|nr:hypothetical protein [Denitrobaculum tricleocarpae]TQV79583.1 hypothetical protein FKG95_12710 [Denitrobaculum tricleocarpae]